MSDDLRMFITPELKTDTQTVGDLSQQIKDLSKLVKEKLKIDVDINDKAGKNLNDVNKNLDRSKQLVKEFISETKMLDGSLQRITQRHMADGSITTSTYTKQKQQLESVSKEYTKLIRKVEQLNVAKNKSSKFIPISGVSNVNDKYASYKLASGSDKLEEVRQKNLIVQQQKTIDLIKSRETEDKKTTQSIINNAKREQTAIKELNSEYGRLIKTTKVLDANKQPIKLARTYRNASGLETTINTSGDGSPTSYKVVDNSAKLEEARERAWLKQQQNRINFVNKREEIERKERAKTLAMNEKAEKEANNRWLAQEQKRINFINQRNKKEQELRLFQERMVGNGGDYTGEIDIFASKQKGKYDSDALKTLKDDIKKLNIDTPDLDNKIKRLTNNFTSLKKQAGESGSVMVRAMENAGKFLRFYLVGGFLVGGFTAFKNAINYVGELDNALNEVRIVTGKTQQEVEGLAVSYNKLAKEMSITTAEVANVSADLYRQGISDEEVEKRMKGIIQYAKISGIQVEESTKIITATANATGESVEKITDIFSLLGDLTASGPEEIGESMQRVASAAANSNVSLEKTASWIATISSITRESASTIGRSLNTMISRYESIKETGFNEEDATQINDVTKALTSIGITAVDSSGQLRDFSEVMDEIGAIFPTLEKNEKSYIATTMFGTFQRNRGITLLNNYANSLQNYEWALNSAGSTEEKFNIYQESTQAHIDGLKASIEDFQKSLFSSEGIKNLISGLTTLIDTINLLVNNPLSKAIITIALLTTSFAGLQSLVGILGKTFLGVVPSITMSLAGIIKTTVATKDLGGAIKALTVVMSKNPLFAAAIAVTGVIALISLIKEMTGSLESQKEAVATLTSEIQNLQLEYDQLFNKENKTSEEEYYLELLREEIELKKQSAAIKSSDVASKKYFEPEYAYESTEAQKIENDIKKLDDIYNKIQNNKFKSYASLKKAQQEFVNIRSNLVTTEKDLAKIIEDMESLDSKLIDQDLLADLKSLRLSIYLAKYATEDHTEANKENADSSDQAAKSAEEQAKALTELQEALSTASSNISKVNSVLKDYAENGKFSTDQIIDLAETYPQLLSMLGNEEAIRLELIKIIKDEEKAAEEAYKAKMIIDEKYFKNKIKNTGILQKKLGEFYSEDLENAKDLADAKFKVEETLYKELTFMWAKYFNAQGDFIGKAIIDGGRTIVGVNGTEQRITDEDRRRMIEWENQRKKAAKAFDDIYLSTGKVDFSGIGLGSDSTSDKSSKQAKEDTYAFNELETQLKKLENAYAQLEHRKSLMADHDQKRLNIITDEIKSVEDQIKLKKQQIELNKKEINTAKTASKTTTKTTAKTTSSGEEININVKNPFGSEFKVNANNPYGKKNANYALGYHTGIDYTAPKGTNIKSVVPGTVISAKDMGAYGNAVIVQDKNGKYHLYGHMSAMNVKSGDSVNAGDILGKIGNTGKSTGIHLHYEVRSDPNKQSSNINPSSYLSGNKFTSSSTSYGTWEGSPVTSQEQGDAIQRGIQLDRELAELQKRKIEHQVEYRYVYDAIAEREVELIDKQIQMEQVKNRVNEEGSEAYNKSIEKQLVLYAKKKDALHEEANALRDIVGSLEDLSKNDGIDRSAEIDRWNDKLQEVKLSYEQIQASIVDIRRAQADQVINIIKDVLEEQIDAIDKQIEKEDSRHKRKINNIKKEQEAFNKAIDDQIEAIRKLRDEEDFDKELGKKQTKAQDLRNKISLAMLDTSPAGKARLAELQKELGEVLEGIAEMQSDREYDLRVENLEDIKETNDEKVEDAIETAEEELEAVKKGLEKQKQALQDVLNDQKVWSDLSEAIAKGHFDKVSDMFGDFADLISDNSKDLGGRIQKDLIDKLKEAEKLLDNVTGGKDNESTDGGSGSSKVNGYIIGDDGKYIEVKKGKLTGGDGKSYTIDEKGNMYDTRGEFVKKTSLYDPNDLNGYIISDNGQQIVVTNGKLTGGDGKLYTIDEKGNMYDKNGKFVRKARFNSFHAGGVVGNKSSKELDIVNELFNTAPNEEIIKALQGELMVPAVNVGRNFIPNMQSLVNSVPRDIIINSKDEKENGITYNLNLRIDNVTGDKKGADFVYDELVKGLKKIGNMR